MATANRTKPKAGQSAFERAFKKKAGNKAAKKPVRASDWSKKINLDDQRFDILPPVDIAFGDAVVCKYNPKATREENIAAHDKHARKMRLRLMAAAAILSQTVEGRENLNTLKKLGYTVKFDTATCKDKKALGLCRFSDKEILLSEEIDDLARLALVMNHEAAHSRLGQHVTPHSSIRLEDQMLVVNVHEAHARASEAKVALEVMVGHPKGPETQLKTDRLINDIKNRYPLIAKAAVSAGAQAGNVHDGQVMADAFIAYFSEKQIRTGYEERHGNWLGDLEVEVLKNKKTHRKRVNTKKLKAALKDGKVPYLVRHRPNVNLSFPRYRGVSPQNVAAFQKAWKRFKKHAPLNTVRPPKIPVYPPVPERGFIQFLKDALKFGGKKSKPSPKPVKKPSPRNPA